MNIVPLFSTPLYRNTIPFSCDVVNYIKKLKYTSFGPGYVNCFKSVNDNVINDLYLQDLKKYIQDNIEFYLRNILKFSFNVNFFITKSWVIKHSTHHYSQRHIHTNSLFTGVVYLDVNEDSGNIVFCRTGPSSLYPDQLTLETTENNIYNSDTLIIHPKNNDIIIFPSGLAHEVTPNTSHKDRYVLSFNTHMVGTIGSNTLQELAISTR